MDSARGRGLFESCLLGREKQKRIGVGIKQVRQKGLQVVQKISTNNAKKERSRRNVKRFKPLEQRRQTEDLT